MQEVHIPTEAKIYALNFVTQTALITYRIWHFIFKGKVWFQYFNHIQTVIMKPYPCFVAVLNEGQHQVLVKSIT